MAGATKQVTRIASSTAKKRLAIVWFAGTGVPFAIMLVQSLVGFYGEQAAEAWSWFLPSVAPTLTLIVGVLVSDALGKSEPRSNVDRFIFRLSLGLSLVYLVTVSLTILIAPLAAMSPFALMKLSQLWLVPFQALVSAALGAFFVNRS